MKTFAPLRVFITFPLLACVSAAAADPYGTLFTTPEQRARLDAARNGAAIAAAAPDQGQGVTVKPEALKLNGTLVSSFGNKEVWVNGEPRLQGTDATGPRVQVLHPDRVRLQTSAGAAVHDMKPGQVLDPGTGQLREAWQQEQTQQASQE
ncbi:MAG: hypothetical protein J5I92_09400 [Thiogranum sp.]|nr:hypothetical protein [Thiogranum sp.]